MYGVARVKQYMPTVRSYGYGWVLEDQLRWSMRETFALGFLLFLTLGAFAETQPTNTDDGPATHSHHLNMGWVGLAGLIGLLGLRYQKSVAHERTEAAGVKVTTVPVHLPQNS